MVLLTIVNEPAETPPKLTVVAPVKLFPIIVTVVPEGAMEGAKLITPGSRFLFLSKDTLLLVKIAPDISFKPSPSKSPIAT